MYELANTKEAALVRKQKVVRDEGTEQTRKRLKMDPVDFMVAHWGKKYRDITALEAAAREIRRLFAYTTSGLTPRAVDLNIVATGASQPMPEWLAIKRRDIYIPWAQACKVERFNILIKWLVDEKTLAQCDKEANKRKGFSKEVVVYCLTDYAQRSGNIRRLPSIV